MTVQEQRTLDKLKNTLRAHTSALLNESYFDVLRDDGTHTRQKALGLIPQLQMVIAAGWEHRGSVRSSNGLPIVISVQAFDIMAGIEHVSRKWETDRLVTDRLAATCTRLCGRSIEAIPDIRKVSRYLESWVRLIRDLFEPPRLLHLVAACPQCDESTVTLYHMDEIDPIQAPALQIMRTSNGLVCECFACGTRWPDTHFVLLAQALGCDAVV